MSANGRRSCWWLWGCWAIAIVSVWARVQLVLLIDRDGGVTAIGVKRAPSLEYRRFESTESFQARGNYVLVVGNENDVFGMDLLKDNARFGWAVTLGSALALTAACWRARQRPASNTRQP